MEQVISYPIDAQNKVNTIQKSKSQKRRESRKKSKLQVLISQLEIEKKALKAGSRLDNINKMLLEDSQLEELPEEMRLEKLNLLANLFLFQSSVIKEIRCLARHTKILRETASQDSATCFSIDGNKCLCGHDYNDICFTKELITSDAKLLAIKKVAPMLLSDDFWNDYRLIDQWYNYSTTLIDSKNEEISIIGKFIKNKITVHLLEYGINLLWDNIVATLSTIRFNRADQVDEIEDMIFNVDLDELILAGLREHKIVMSTHVLLPNFIEMALDMMHLKYDFNDLWDENANFAELKNASDIDKKTGAIIRQYDQLEGGYKDVYQSILSQLPLDKRAVLVPYLSVMPEDLALASISDSCPFNNEFIQTLEHPEKSEVTQDFDFISELVSNQPKQVKQSGGVKKKKNRSRRKNQRKNVAEKEESVQKLNLSKNKKATSRARTLRKESSELQQEFIQLPNYAQRVLNWFDSEYIAKAAPEVGSIFYHTYSLLADFIIKKYGTNQLQPNQTNSDLTDSGYYMPGQIKHSNGDTETVVFGICFGSDGSCYHRGYSKLNDADLSPEFAKSKHHYDFPDLSIEFLVDKKRVKVNNDLCKDTQYTETSTYVELYDSVNEVTITLFKP